MQAPGRKLLFIFNAGFTLFTLPARAGLEGFVEKYCITEYNASKGGSLSEST